MINDQEAAVDIKQAEEFLVGKLGSAPQELKLIGEGAWSRCFGFRQGEQELAIRFGRYLNDFRKDQLAYAYATPELPIPEVLEIGAAFDGYYALASRHSNSRSAYIEAKPNCVQDILTEL